MFALQGSLLDVAESPTLRSIAGGVRRLQLGAGAWVDLRPGWLSGVDEVFTVLRRDVPWRAELRQMYDSVVDVPRLTAFFGVGEELPHPLLAVAREALTEHY